MALKTVCAMTLTLCLFANGQIPPTPPSSAEQQQLSERVKSYIHTLEQVPQEVSCTHELWPYSDAVVASKGPGLVVVDFARSEPKRTEGLVSQVDLKPLLEDEKSYYILEAQKIRCELPMHTPSRRQAELIA
jgi:hypothetical protein